MLELAVTGNRYFDEDTNEFVVTQDRTLLLEHSLISLSKWESKWEQPFLGKQSKTREQTLDYIRCMSVNRGVPEETFLSLSQENIKDIVDYIDAPMTATTFRDSQSAKGPGEIVTSELIYYWMITSNIPMECQKWHLNRLLTLIRVCSVKNTPPKKMNRSELARERRALNAQRRASLGSTG